MDFDKAPHVIDEVKRGNAALFLGAGASMGATTTGGNTMPATHELGVLLSSRFLGGEHSEKDLSMIAEPAIPETDLISVQLFLKEFFKPFQPASFHHKIASFKWRSIYTTNYDLIIEQVYRVSKFNIQELIPIYSSTDRVESSIKSEKQLPFVKSHDCITKIDDPPPLILSLDQYVTHRDSRESLFNRLLRNPVKLRTTVAPNC